MGLRDSLPAPWAVLATALAGLAAGVVLGRLRPPAPGAVPEASPPSAAPGPGASPAGPRAVVLPGGPPSDVAREMEGAILGAFRGDAADPAAQAARDAAFAKVRDLVARWGASAPRHPLAATAWWRAALGRALPTGEGEPRGILETSVRFLGQDLPLVLSVPEGPGPFPAVLAALGGGDLRGEVGSRYGPILGSHLVAAMGPGEALAGDPRTLLLALGEAARRYPVDRDRVALDGTGACAAAVADLATDAARQFCGAVLRVPPPGGPLSENLALFPVLTGEPPAGDRPGAVGGWIGALPPRRCADPRNPWAFATVTGERYRSFGHWFVVKRVRGSGPGRPVRVRIARDAGRNAVLLGTENVAEIQLLLNDEGLDLDQPVKVVHGGMVIEERRVGRSLDTLRAWAAQGEPGLVVAAEMAVRIPE